MKIESADNGFAQIRTIETFGCWKISESISKVALKRMSIRRPQYCGSLITAAAICRTVSCSSRVSLHASMKGMISRITILRTAPSGQTAGSISKLGRLISSCPRRFWSMFPTRVSIFRNHFAPCAKEGSCFSLPMESGLFIRTRRTFGGGLRRACRNKCKRRASVSSTLKEWLVPRRLASSFSRTRCYQECLQVSETPFATGVSEQCNSSTHAPAQPPWTPMHASSFVLRANSDRLHESSGRLL